VNFEWPEELVDITTAAALFTRAGKPVDRTNLGRFIATRNFPVKQDGRRRLVNARELFDAYRTDFSRQVMSGESTGAAPASKSNPKLREAELRAQSLELDLAERLRKVVPVEEVASAQAEAIAQLRAAYAQAVSDQAEALLIELALPAHKLATIKAGLKRFARIGQEKFAQALAPLISAQGDIVDSARIRLDRITELAVNLLAENGSESVERELEMQG
jgi:hypothetical protein